MGAVYKRELRSYLVTPAGYVFLAIFYAVSGYYFFGYNLYGQSSDFGILFSMLYSFAIFLVPILTMKLFSEERRNRTDQQLLTAPVSLGAIVGGKYLASMTLYLAAQAVTLVYLAIVSVLGEVDLPVFFGNFLGLFLVGMAICALGMFISSLTESQVIAAVGTLGAGMLFMMLGSIGEMLGGGLLGTVLDYLTLSSHSGDFSLGVLNLSDLVFFLSFAGLFFFLTMRVLEKRRWS